MIHSIRFFLLLFCIFSLQKVFAAEQRSIFDLSDLLGIIDSVAGDAEKVKAVRSFLVSQSTEWEQSENCRMANTNWGRSRSRDPWSQRTFFLNLENNPQSENGARVLKIFREFRAKPVNEQTYDAREAMNSLIDSIPLDPIPDCTTQRKPIDYTKLTQEHLRIFILARIELGKDIYSAYLKSYWTSRGRSEVYQRLIFCQREFHDVLGASLYCFTNLTQSLNSSVQNRALNFLQEAALLSILLDRNSARPCLGSHLQLLLDNKEAFDAASIFSPIHNMQDAHALQMRFACGY